VDGHPTIGRATEATPGGNLSARDDTLLSPGSPNKSSGFSQNSPNILYQADYAVIQAAIEENEALVNTAQDFPSWEAFRDYYSPDWLFEEGSEESAANGRWYKSVWENAREFAGEVAESAAKSVTPPETLTSAQIDDRLLDRFQDEGFLDRFLAHMWTYLDRNNPYEGKAGTAEDVRENERSARLRDRLEREVHPTILTNAQRVARGRLLTEPARRQIMTLLRRGYRFTATFTPRLPVTRSFQRVPCSLSGEV
jgi:hypothetical protein